MFVVKDSDELAPKDLSQLSFSEKSDLYSLFLPCWEIIGQKILWEAVWYRNAVLTELLINLNDLLQKLRKYGHRLTFNDDIHSEISEDDITDYINHFRNAACHMISSRTLIDPNSADGNMIAFTWVQGNVDLGDFNNVRVSTDHQDDWAILMGAKPLYVKRHLERVVYELKDKLQGVISYLPEFPID